MKRLTYGTSREKNDSSKDIEKIEKSAGKRDAKCCAKTSKHAVGCHD